MANVPARWRYVTSSKYVNAILERDTKHVLNHLSGEDKLIPFLQFLKVWSDKKKAVGVSSEIKNMWTKWIDSSEMKQQYDLMLDKLRFPGMIVSGWTLFTHVCKNPYVCTLWEHIDVIVAKGIPIDTSILKDGYTLLYHLVECNDLKELKQALLIPDINVNALNSKTHKYPISALQRAIIGWDRKKYPNLSVEDNQAIFETLLSDPRIDITKCDRYGRSPLESAIIKKSTRILLALLIRPKNSDIQLDISFLAKYPRLYHIMMDTCLLLLGSNGDNDER